MNTTSQTLPHPHRSAAFRWIANESVITALVAIAIIALAIVGLAGVYPLLMAAIATIVTGAAVLIEGGIFEGSSFSSQSETAAGTAAGMRADVLGAMAGIVLGILALLGVSPATLVSVAVLIFGATFLLSGAVMPQQNWFTGQFGGQLLLGLSIVILGLLAIIGVDPITLALVGLMLLGAAGLFGGVLGLKGKS